MHQFPSFFGRLKRFRGTKSDAKMWKGTKSDAKMRAAGLSGCGDYEHLRRQGLRGCMDGVNAARVTSRFAAY
jgi:hypothetical protein